MKKLCTLTKILALVTIICTLLSLIACEDNSSSSKSKKTEPIESIICGTVTLKNTKSEEIIATHYLNGVPLFVFNFTPSKEGSEYTSNSMSVKTNPNKIRINYEVTPSLADRTKVTFEFDTAAMEGVAVFNENSKTLIFLKPETILYVTIRATDGSNKSTRIAIMGRDSQ